MSESVEPISTAPLYEHDCSACTFLGTFNFDEVAFDLYFCTQSTDVPTVIGRRSSDPHDYSSGMELADFDPVLREARERAKERGLYPLTPRPEPDPFK